MLLLLLLTNRDVCPPPAPCYLLVRLIDVLSQHHFQVFLVPLPVLCYGPSLPPSGPFLLFLLEVGFKFLLQAFVLEALTLPEIDFGLAEDVVRAATEEKLLADALDGGRGGEEGGRGGVKWRAEASPEGT